MAVNDAEQTSGTWVGAAIVGYIRLPNVYALSMFSALRLRANNIYLAIGMLALLITLCFGVSTYNRVLMADSQQLRAEIDTIRTQYQELIGENVRAVDISIRGYALMQDSSFIFIVPAKLALYNRSRYQSIERLLAKHQFPESERWEGVKREVEAYGSLYATCLQLIADNRVDEFRKVLSEDPGRKPWAAHMRFTEALDKYEGTRYLAAKSAYEVAAASNNWLLGGLLVLGLPTLLMITRRLRRDNRHRHQLMQQLDENNRRYIFDDGTRLEDRPVERVIESSIERFQAAATFVRSIRQGNLAVEWPGWQPDSSGRNLTSLAGELRLMKEELVEIREADQQRQWLNQGLTDLSELIRRHQAEPETLAHETVRYLCKYLNAQQASLFVLTESARSAPYLRLAACYAFDRRKHLEKRVEIGQGLVGQCFLEAQTTHLTALPANYLAITSGLGEATPGNLVIVPLRHNERVVAVLEMAGFGPFGSSAIQLLDRGGEFVASALLSADTAARMQQLLDDSRQEDWARNPPLFRPTFRTHV